MDNLGAGNAALKIHEMLKKKKIDSDLFVKKKSHINSKKFILEKRKQKIHEFFFDSLNYISNKILNNRLINKDLRSLGWFTSPYNDIINNSNFDIVQLHWINNFISINDIANIKKPLIWRFSDMWPILGTKHYVNENENIFNSNQSSFLEKNNFLFKKKKWKNKINVISPSYWLEKHIKKSEISQNWTVNVIHTPINSETFIPLNRLIIKNELGIKNERVLIFGADNLLEKRKGLKTILNIFTNKLVDQKDNYILLLFGKGKIKEKKINNLKIMHFGYLKSKIEINKLYNAADVMILPSTIDNLPQIGLEAQTSGLPVIAFKNSGLEEIIDENKTGIFTDLETSENLSFHISNFFNKTESLHQYRQNSRIRSLNLWSEEKVFEKYMNLYSKILEENKR